jgi:nucleoside-diphosphate-sugar epimerase
MKKVLVTGANGFVGRHCLEPLLARGFEIHAVSSRDVLDGRAWRAENGMSPSISWHQANLLDINNLGLLLDKIKPTHLLHLAWVTEQNAYWTSPLNLDWVGASLALVKAFAERGGVRVTVAGTCAEYDWRNGRSNDRSSDPPNGRCSEDNTPLTPATLYGICKRALCSMLEEYARQTRLGFSWGRIFFAYGPFENRERMVPSIISSLLNNEEAACRKGTFIRDFLHVSDVGRAFAQLLDTPVDGSFNICSGVQTSLGDVTLKIGRALGKENLCKIETPEAGNDETAVLFGDAKKTRDAIGFVPLFSLDTGLADTIAWWKKHPLHG